MSSVSNGISSSASSLNRFCLSYFKSANFNPANNNLKRIGLSMKTALQDFQNTLHPVHHFSTSVKLSPEMFANMARVVNEVDLSKDQKVDYISSMVLMSSYMRGNARFYSEIMNNLKGLRPHIEGLSTFERLTKGVTDTDLDAILSINSIAFPDMPFDKKELVDRIEKGLTYVNRVGKEIVSFIFAVVPQCSFVQGKSVRAFDRTIIPLDYELLTSSRTFKCNCQGRAVYFYAVGTSPAWLGFSIGKETVFSAAEAVVDEDLFPKLKHICTFSPVMGLRNYILDVVGTGSPNIAMEGDLSALTFDGEFYPEKAFTPERIDFGDEQLEARLLDTAWNIKKQFSEPSKAKTLPITLGGVPPGLVYQQLIESGLLRDERFYPQIYPMFRDLFYKYISTWGKNGWPINPVLGFHSSNGALPWYANPFNARLFDNASMGSAIIYRYPYHGKTEELKMSAEIERNRNARNFVLLCLRAKGEVTDQANLPEYTPLDRTMVFDNGQMAHFPTSYRPSF